jgi:hypothetical protein
MFNGTRPASKGPEITLPAPDVSPSFSAAMRRRREGEEERKASSGALFNFRASLVNLA